MDTLRNLCPFLEARLAQLRRAILGEHVNMGVVLMMASDKSNDPTTHVVLSRTFVFAV